MQQVTHARVWRSPEYTLIVFHDKDSPWSRSCLLKQTRDDYRFEHRDETGRVIIVQGKDYNEVNWTFYKKLGWSYYLYTRFYPDFRCKFGDDPTARYGTDL
jgi:hypothetical protein